MESLLDFQILPQPDDTTCGPTCLHAVYAYFGEALPLREIIASTARLRSGGTLAVFLGCDALRRGYKARLYTYNLQVFDPTWFSGEGVNLPEKLRRQLDAKKGRRLEASTRGYLEFLRLGGEIRFEDLSSKLVRRYLKRNIPILTGLSSTYLYRTAREFGPEDDEDDIRGEPAGHFVVLCGYDPERRLVRVADPLHPNPTFPEPLYAVPTERVITAILLGILTYDANLLMIEPGRKPSRSPL